MYFREEYLLDDVDRWLDIAIGTGKALPESYYGKAYLEFIRWQNDFRGGEVLRQGHDFQKAKLYFERAKNYLKKAVELEGI
ncbi:hypothetical protein HCQ94_03800 [Actinomyces sp. zg-332]|uniref:hypothetical protein n=1 Tax=Actinomyces sp. zg-332 TaxID=2708340 RepID=UPI0014248166|nr:hypothetical protein [Actinomyces sp. zg-332]QPK93727.1 hypothetical protein HCQ94_03800 [Actinomyces sp. zg-332]